MHGIKQAKNGFKLTTRRLAATSIVKVTQVKHSEDDGQTQFFLRIIGHYYTPMFSTYLKENVYTQPVCVFKLSD